MKNLLFIEIPNHPDFTENTLHSWYRKTSENETWGKNHLAEIANQLENTQVIAVISGLQLSYYQIQSKIRNRKKLEQAMAYELEEQLSEEIEQLFFAYQTDKEDKNLLQIAVINRHWFEHLLNHFKHSQITLTAIISDIELCKKLPIKQVFIEQSENILLKTPSSIQAIDKQNLGFWLQKLQPELSETISVIAVEHNHCFSNLNLPINIEYCESILQKLTINNHWSTCINLLQGNYQPKLKTGWLWIQWGLIASFILLFIVTSFQAYQRWQLTKQETDWEQQREALFHKSFPQIKRIVDPLAQMKHEIQQLQQNQQRQGQFMLILAKISAGLSQSIQQQQLHLIGLEFQNNHFSLHLNATSFAMIEKAKSELEQQQLSVGIESEGLDKANNQVNATFKIDEIHL